MGRKGRIDGFEFRNTPADQWRVLFYFWNHNLARAVHVGLR